jgi:hypothetical protein
LIAAAPARADRIPYPGSAKGASNPDIAAQVSRSSGLNSPVKARFRADFLPIAEFIGMIDVNNAFDVRDSRSSPIPNPLFATPSGTDIHHVKLSGLESDGRDFDGSNARKASRYEIKENRETDKFNGKDSSVPVLVPEPGSLSLLLLGLGALGSFALPRGQRPIEI